MVWCGVAWRVYSFLGTRANLEQEVELAARPISNISFSAVR